MQKLIKTLLSIVFGVLINLSTLTFEGTAQIRLPAGYDEVQAMLLNWPVTTDPQTGLINGVDVTSQDAVVLANFIREARSEAAIWICLPIPDDTSAVLTFLNNRDAKPSRYQFIHLPTNNSGNLRDYGPVFFYQNDTLKVLDLIYVPELVDDDSMAVRFGALRRLPVVSSYLYAEGSHFMGDGHGTVVYGRYITKNNSNPDVTPDPWPIADTQDTLKRLTGASVFVELDTLVCDPAFAFTQYVTFLNPQTVLVNEYGSNMPLRDRATLNAYAKTLSETMSTYGKPFQVLRVSAPTDENGQLPSDCEALSLATRSYTSGVFVNRKYIIPSYGQDNPSVIQLYRRVLNGYTLSSIDCNALAFRNTTLNRVVIPVPVSDPFYGWTPPLDTIHNLPSTGINLRVKITHPSGVRRVWWVYSTKQGKDSVALSLRDGFWVATVPTNRFTPNDTVTYHYRAESNTGRQRTFPLAGEQGSIRFRRTSSRINPDHQPFYCYPNPTNGRVTLRYPAGSGSVIVTNLQGQVVFEAKLVPTAQQIELNLDALPAGIYRLTTSGQVLSQKLVIVH